MDKVIILMAAWQGEKFLKEQIDSILAQDSIDLQLIVRDDASKDSTLEILYSYARRFPDKVVVYENKENIYCGNRDRRCFNSRRCGVICNIGQVRFL